jgi:hypothetical protein
MLWSLFFVYRGIISGYTKLQRSGTQHTVSKQTPFDFGKQFFSFGIIRLRLVKTIYFILHLGKQAARYVLVYMNSVPPKG